MKCRYCGHEIPEGVLYCERCGKEVIIVPEYNPLDDVLAAQVKGSIEGTQSPLDDYEYTHPEREPARRQGPSRNTAARRNTGRTASRNTSSRNTASRNTNSRNTSSRNLNNRNTDSMQERKRQAMRKKALKKKKRQRALIILAIIFVIGCILGFILYQNSYSGLVSKGNKAANSQQYDEATDIFNRAVTKRPQRPEAYTGLSKIFIAQNNMEEAENVYLDAIEKYSSDTELYQACITFYIDTKQESQVSVLLEDAPKAVRTALNKYISRAPTFSLDDEEKYDDVQQLTLTTQEEEIYYTTDGSEPTIESTKYTEPIQIEEGENVITAISVNKEGIPSLSSGRTYTVELPIEDAPAVTPSTGQYDSATQITVNVPDGYVAYYTTDRTDPTTSSTQYTGPVDMPEGSTIFKAVLVNAKGRMSGITTRNYELTY